MFRFFVKNDVYNEAGKGIALGSLFLGLFMIGFGMLVFILRDLFAFLAAAIFFMAGFSAIGYGLRAWWAFRKMSKDRSPYRQNVEIHYNDSEF